MLNIIYRTKLCCGARLHRVESFYYLYLMPHFYSVETSNRKKRKRERQRGTELGVLILRAPKGVPVPIISSVIGCFFCFWVPTITRDTGRLGASWGFQHFIAVHQVAVILFTRLRIHNRNIRDDGYCEEMERMKSLQINSYGLWDILSVIF